MGTWKLNEAKSKLAPGVPKNTTVVYEAAGDNVKVTVDGTDREYRWLVDPIDGTANFVRDLGHWSVSIAAMLGDRPVFGVVYDPVREEMFTGVAGTGAACNKALLRITNVTDLETCQNGEGQAIGIPELVSAGISGRGPFSRTGGFSFTRGFWHRLPRPGGGGGCCGASR